jgi:RNA polymerase sigma-70 factor (sigma-E family)
VGAEPVGVTFENLYRSQHDRMVRLAYLLTGSHAAAEDLVQDAFIRVRPHLEGMDNPGPYLRRSVVNACYSWHRRRGREQRVPPDGPAAVGSGSDHVEMWDALGRLAPARRSVLVLRYYLDLPEAEVAEMLGWRVGTVKSTTHRALRDLRRMLQ